MATFCLRNACKNKETQIESEPAEAYSWKCVKKMEKQWLMLKNNILPWLEIPIISFW